MDKMETLRTTAIEMLTNDDGLFVEMVNELDSWNGFADGFRGFPMYELDELFGHMKVSEFLDHLASDFDHTDEYFIDTIYGISSTDNLAEYYRDNVDEGELLDNIIENAANIYFSDSDLEEIIEAIEEAEE